MRATCLDSRLARDMSRTPCPLPLRLISSSLGLPLSLSPARDCCASLAAVETPSRAASSLSFLASNCVGPAQGLSHTGFPHNPLNQADFEVSPKPKTSEHRPASSKNPAATGEGDWRLVVGNRLNRPTPTVETPPPGPSDEVFFHAGLLRTSMKL